MRDGGGRSLALVVLLALITGCGGDATTDPQASTSPTTPSSPSGTTATPIPESTDPVAIEPGTYRVSSSAWSIVDYTLDIPEGWTVQSGARFFHAPDGPGFEAFVPDTIYADACEGSQGERIEVGPTVDDLAAVLLEQRGSKASSPVETTFGGYPAIRIDLTVPEGLDLKPCNLPDALQILVQPPCRRLSRALPRRHRERVHRRRRRSAPSVPDSVQACDLRRGRAGTTDGPRLDPHRTLDRCRAGRAHRILRTATVPSVAGALPFSIRSSRLPRPAVGNAWSAWAVA